MNYFSDDRYGREDTHYLLYIYDLMRIKLFTLSKESEGCDNPLVEVSWCLPTNWACNLSISLFDY